MSGGTGGGMLQLRFHFGERDRAGDGLLDAAVMNACERRAVRAAALLRGVEGFGAKQRLRTDRLLSLSEDAPLVAVAVGEAGVVEELAEEVRGMASEGLVVVEPVEVMDVSDGGGGGVPGDAVRGAAGEAAAEEMVKATIWGPRSGVESPHLEAVAALKCHGAAAATVLLGVDGVLEGERRRARFVAANRGVPGMTVAVGKRAAIDAAVAELDGAAHLVMVEGVESYSRYERATLHGEAREAGGVERKLRIEPLSHHGSGPSDGAATRVTLVTSEVARHDAHPRYLALIHALRSEGAAGATALRGVYGYRGGGEPRGDRVLALRRDVPIVVETVDSVERAGKWRGVAESLAGEDDAVHSQRIPRIFTLD